LIPGARSGNHTLLATINTFTDYQHVRLSVAATRTSNDVTASIRRIGVPHINAYRAVKYLQDKMSKVIPPDGAFVKDKRSDHPTIYFIEGGKKRRVLDSSILKSWGLTASSRQILRIPADKLKRYSDGSRLGFRPGALVSTSTHPDQSGAVIYAVTNDGGSASVDRWTRGIKVQITAQSFACLGYDYRDVLLASSSDLSLHTTGTAFNSCTTFPNGTIIQTTSGAVNLIQGQKLRLVDQKYVLDSWGMRPNILSGAAIGLLAMRSTRKTR